MTYEKIGAWAITEPDAGSDAFGRMKSYVVRDGEDYILNGQKTFITNGPDADVVVVYAKLDDDQSVDKRDRKVLTFVLDRGMDGFVQSKPFRKMGIHSSRTGELFFTTSGWAGTGCWARPSRTIPATAGTAPGPTSPRSASGWRRCRSA